MSEINPLEVGEKNRSFLSSSGDIKVPNETYRIFGFWLVYILTIIFIVVAFAFLVIGIMELTKGEFYIHDFLVPIALFIISCLLTYFFPFYSSITVDLTNKLVTCRKYKLFFIILDQADSVFGIALVVWMFYPIGIKVYLLFVLVGTITHLLINMLLYFFHLRKNMF